ncbi:hypothetical protein E3A20_04760 [Planctomyces bekefii]|uniref:Uncharacterized protein n=1 Tax=Planctomyces bekefii TaxID=1653850 RepID=A0A5C6MAY1_9PLAN|nr:hypothetical protein E3A20_04760 [Planctomyces bekefii]
MFWATLSLFVLLSSGVVSAQDEWVSKVIQRPAVDGQIWYRASKTVTCVKGASGGSAGACPSIQILVVSDDCTTQIAAQQNWFAKVQELKKQGNALYPCYASNCEVDETYPPALAINPGSGDQPLKMDPIGCGRHRVECLVQLSSGFAIYVTGGGRTLKLAWQDLYVKARKIEAWRGEKIIGYEDCLKWKLKQSKVR